MILGLPSSAFTVLSSTLRLYKGETTARSDMGSFLSNKPRASCSVTLSSAVVEGIAVAERLLSSENSANVQRTEQREIMVQITFVS